MNIPEEITSLYYEDGNGNRWIPPKEHFMGLHPAPAEFIYQVVRRPTELRTAFYREGEGQIGAGVSTWNRELVTKMVLCGVPIDQAILRAAIACERCMNALGYEYDVSWGGYPEDSEEYRKSNTQ